MKRACSFHILALLLALTQISAADTLDVAKGDSVSGQLTGFADGVVHFRTKLAGKIIVPAEEVIRLAIEKPVVVKTKDGAQIEGTIKIEQGKAVVTPKDAKPQSFPLDQIETIKPSKENLPTDPPVRASVEAGVLQRWGDDDYADAFGRIKLFTRLDRTLFGADLFVERADADEFPRWLIGSARLRFNPESLWQPTAGLDFERDTDKNLRSRAGLNLGYTRLFPDLGLEAELGLQAETARWRHDSSDENLNLRFALNYTRPVFQNGAFTNTLSFTPGLISADGIRARSESSLAFPFAQRLQLKLNFLVDYEHYPQLQDLPKWRTSIGASLLWGF